MSAAEDTVVIKKMVDVIYSCDTLDQLAVATSYSHLVARRLCYGSQTLFSDMMNVSENLLRRQRNYINKKAK